MAWEWYFFMQHYGAPTRLLDWSDGDCLSLHFALAHSAGSAISLMRLPESIRRCPDSAVRQRSLMNNPDHIGTPDRDATKSATE